MKNPKNMTKVELLDHVDWLNARDRASYGLTDQLEERLCEKDQLINELMNAQRLQAELVAMLKASMSRVEKLESKDVPF